MCIPLIFSPHILPWQSHEAQFVISIGAFKLTRFFQLLWKRERERGSGPHDSVLVVVSLMSAPAWAR